jgi:hypothetical protein
MAGERKLYGGGLLPISTNIKIGDLRFVWCRVSAPPFWDTLRHAEKVISGGLRVTTVSTGWNTGQGSRENPDIRFGTQLMREATTLRERVFARLISQAMRDESQNRRIHHRAADGGLRVFTLPPGDLTVPALLHDVESGENRQDFVAVPFVGRTYVVDPELPEWLQDLAEIIAYESGEAFQADFYPGVADVDPLTEEHVMAVMEALQREMDREAKRRNKTTVSYVDLPPERRQALAERRRYWFGKFGITPKNWADKTFSLWDVSNDPLPDWMTRPSE